MEQKLIKKKLFGHWHLYLDDVWIAKMRNEANARRFVACWNAHDMLVEACKEARATFIGFVEGSAGGQAMLAIKQAIAEAEK